MRAHSAPWSALRAGAAAVAFLTRLPIGRRLALDASDVARGAMFFPLVGAGIGAVVGLAAVALDEVVPALTAAALAVALDALLTGVIHLDALGDTADAFGGESRTHALEIMRDSRIGAYGAVALTIDLVVKVTAIAAALEHARAVLLVVAAWTVGRSAPLALACVLPYARAAAGSGHALAEGAGTVRLGIGVAVGAAIAAVAAGERAPMALLAAAVALTVLGVGARSRFGGVTGDVLGAATEVTTTLALVGAIATR